MIPKGCERALVMEALMAALRELDQGLDWADRNDLISFSVNVGNFFLKTSCNMKTD